MENYIVINGKKAELTEEQLKALGIEVKKKRNNPFEQVELARRYWYIGSVNNTICSNDLRNDSDDRLYNATNYFNDENFAKQVIWHEELNRRLLKYAWDNEAEDNEWNWTASPVCQGNIHYFIYKEVSSGDQFKIGSDVISRHNEVYFSKQKVAEKAVEEVVKPFMKERPEFVW